MAEADSAAETDNPVVADVPIREIAHPTDLTPESESAFAHSLRLALAARAKLSIINVHHQPGSVEWDDFPGVRDMLARWKVLPPGASAEQVSAAGIAVGKIKLRGSDPARALRQHLEKHPVDLVVLATHRRSGLDRWLHREVAVPVARGAEAWTLFVPRGVSGFVSAATGEVRLSRVLIPVTSQPDPAAAVEAAASVAGLLGCAQVQFRTVHVGAGRYSPGSGIEQRNGWTWQAANLRGEVVEELLGAARQFRPHLVAIASQGRTGFLDALRGSTSERLLAGLRCPMLAVPAAA